MSPAMFRVVSLFLLLLFAHALADYPLQGGYLARAKRRGGVPGVPWQWALFMHTFIHAMGVVLVTNSLSAGALELVAHGTIDYHKCAGRFGVIVDQTLHLATKVMIVALLYAGVIR